MHTVQTSPNQCKTSTILSAPSWTLRTTAQSPVSSPGPPRPQTAGGRRAKRPHRTAARGTTGLNRPSRAAPRRRADLLSCPARPSCQARDPLPGGGRQPSPVFPPHRQRVRPRRRAGKPARSPGQPGGPAPAARSREGDARGRKPGLRCLATGRAAPPRLRALGACRSAPS